MLSRVKTRVGAHRFFPPLCQAFNAFRATKAHYTCLQHPGIQLLRIPACPSSRKIVRHRLTGFVQQKFLRLINLSFLLHQCYITHRSITAQYQVIPQHSEQRILSIPLFSPLFVRQTLLQNTLQPSLSAQGQDILSLPLLYFDDTLPVPSLYVQSHDILQSSPQCAEGRPKMLCSLPQPSAGKVSVQDLLFVAHTS